jgi:hypothetical protein
LRQPLYKLVDVVDEIDAPRATGVAATVNEEAAPIMRLCQWIWMDCKPEITPCTSGSGDEIFYPIVFPELRRLHPVLTGGNRALGAHALSFSRIIKLAPRVWFSGYCRKYEWSFGTKCVESLSIKPK